MLIFLNNAKGDKEKSKIFKRIENTLPMNIAIHW